MDLTKYVASIPDFPKEGILFRDVTPMIQDPDAYKEACDVITRYAKEKGAELIVGPESRGFLVGCPAAYNLHIGFAPVRKPGKLPRETISCTYDLEYGSNELQIHADAVKTGQKVLIVDDLLATGGTVDATAKLVEKLGGVVVGCAFLIELVDLPGRELLKKYDVFSAIQYHGE